MSKRFIDTELFDDEWFCELSKDAKLFFIYFIVKCDHAGILRLNKKLFEFQTGVKTFETLIKEFNKRLVTVKDGVYFMPKYLKFQYPNFPQSNVKQQSGAINILISYGLWNNENGTLAKELTNSYDNDNVIVNDNDNVIVKEDDIHTEFLNIFKTITGKSKIKSIDNKTKKQLSELLKSYDMKDIALAISNATKDSYHIETEHKYITPEFITRPDKFQKFVSILPKKDEIKQIIPMPKYSTLEIDRVKVVLSDWNDNEKKKYFEDNKHHIELANEIKNGKY